jgi:glycosyltransferase involved in cell wall biosynthesis
LRKLYIITTSDLPNHVILGHASFAKKAGFNPVFIFPDRGNGTKYDFAYSDYECIKLNSYFNVRNHLTYLISLIKLFFEISIYFLKRKKKAQILAVDFECTIICFILKINKYKIYSLVNDNFAIRYKFPKLVYFLIKNIEAFTYKYLSEMCIFPDECRVELLGKIRPSKYIIIPNILDSNIGDIYYRGDSSNNLTVLMCGWLESTRGFDILIDIINKTNDNIDFILAGSGNYLLQYPELAYNKRVIYKGMLSRVENLKLMSSVDINFCFYNPDIIINRFALAQKVTDSILIGCPIFINSEVALSNNLVSKNVAISSKYFDITDIANKLNSLKRDKSILQSMSRNVLLYKSTQKSYSEIEEFAIIEYQKLINI